MKISLIKLVVFILLLTGVVVFWIIASLEIKFGLDLSSKNEIVENGLKLQSLIDKFVIFFLIGMLAFFFLSWNKQKK